VGIRHATPDSHANEYFLSTSLNSIFKRVPPPTTADTADLDRGGIPAVRHIVVGKIAEALNNATGKVFSYYEKATCADPHKTLIDAFERKANVTPFSDPYLGNRHVPRSAPNGSIVCYFHKKYNILSKFYFDSVIF